jgi:hypothetical protein
LIGLSSVILKGAGDHATTFSYTAFAGETNQQRLDYANHGVFFSMRCTNYSRVQDIHLDARDPSIVDGSAQASMCVIISSHGYNTPLPFKNCLYGCYITGYNDVGVTPAHADVIVRSNVGSFVRITDTILEMDHHPFIIQDASGVPGPFNVGDNVAGCSIIVDGVQSTYTWGTKPDVATP